MGLLPRGLSVPMEDVKAVPPPGLLTLNCLFICKSTHTIISTYGKSFRGPPFISGTLDSIKRQQREEKVNPIWEIFSPARRRRRRRLIRRSFCH